MIIGNVLSDRGSIIINEKNREQLSWVDNYDFGSERKNSLSTDKRKMSLNKH